ncbi:MAG: GIY-YIG nuclease family protein [Acidimicrobiales bacterium]
MPKAKGVYAWYRDGEAVYSGSGVGKEGIRGRVWKYHLKSGPDLSRSSFRRNVCQHLDIAPTSETKARPTTMTDAQVAPVNRWIRDCAVAWIECDSAEEALDLERDLHAEWLPPLSRR